MEDIIVEKSLNNYSEVLPFIDKVFKENFIKIQPKIYLHDEYIKCHFIVKDRQKIVGNVLSYPLDYHCNGQVLKVCGIGNVAVAKSSRGKSLMSKMMTAAVEDARESGVDYMFLGGNRKRYERFGFVPCNTTIQFLVIKENIQHTTKYNKVEFIKLQEGSELLVQVEQLYNQQNSRYDRKYFYEVLKTWNKNKIYAIMFGGKVIGHISAGLIGIVDINIISDNVSAKDVVVSYFNTVRKLPVMKVFAYANRPDIVNSLSELCQSHTSDQCGMINILDYKHCMQVLLNMHETCCEWSIVLEVADVCSLEITSKNGSVNVVDTTKVADVVLPKHLAAIILTNAQLANMHGLPFCLPLYITNPDDI